MAKVRFYVNRRKSFLAVSGLCVGVVLCGLGGAFGLPNTAGGIAGALMLIAMHIERVGGVQS